MTTILDTVHDFTSAAEGTVADLLGHARPVATSAMDVAASAMDTVRHAKPAAASAVESVRHHGARSGPPRGLMLLLAVVIAAIAVMAMKRRSGVDTAAAARTASPA